MGRFNKDENPLLYESCFDGNILKLKISLNDNFPKIKVGLPFQFDVYVKDSLIDRLLNNLSSREDISKTLKQEINSKFAKLRETMPGLLGIVNKYKQEYGESVVLTHGDIATSNILFTESKTIRLIDFDIIGMNFFCCDLMYFLNNLRYLVNYETAEYVMGNDVEVLFELVAKYYLEERGLDIPLSRFTEMLHLADVMNTAMYTLIWLLVILENGIIEGLPTVSPLMDNYFERYNRFVATTTLFELVKT